jgi:hypothetical protein
MPRQYTPHAIIVCVTCGKEFSVVASKASQRRYCSRACCQAAELPKATLTCAQCNKVFVVIASKVAHTRFCSQSCYENSLPPKVVFTCPICGKEQLLRASSVDKYHYCSFACRHAAATPSDILFLRHVDKTGNCYGCHFFRGATYPSGYGAFNSDEFTGHAHRYAYILAYGPIPEDLYVLHGCSGFYEPGDISYRRCCEPSHLRTGTQKENVQQSLQEGRAAAGERSFSRLHPERLLRGEDHQNSILTNQIVLALRSRFTGKRGEIAALAREFGLNDGTVSGVVNDKSWKHLL